MTIRIATGIARREGRVLLVASRYANHERPLWTLPGGRQEAGELARETVVREVREETGLTATVDDLAYFSESYDGETHVANATYAIDVNGDLRPSSASDHVVAVEWLTIDDVRERMTVAIVREPLLAYLQGDRRRYYGFHDAGVTIQWLE